MLTEQDKKVITEAIGIWGSFENVTVHLLRIFGNDMTPAHWYYAGFVYGQKATRVKALNIQLN